MERKNRPNIYQETLHKRAESQFASWAVPIMDEARNWVVNNVMARPEYESAAASLPKPRLLDNSCTTLASFLGFYEMLQKFPAVAEDLRKQSKALIRIPGDLKDFIFVLEYDPTQPREMLREVSERRMARLPDQNPNSPIIRQTMIRALELVESAYFAEGAPAVLPTGLQAVP